MIKKFMSKALLSVFMDKKARTTLNKARTGKNKPVASPKVKPAVAPAPLELNPLSDMGHDEITALIRDSLDAAEQEVIDNKKKALDKKTKSTANPSRQDLIDNALAIHKAQSHIVDDLPEEQRQKLKLIAIQAFGEQLKNN